MAFQLSPGVVVTETDLTSVVPAVASTTGAFVGNFQWGPAGEIVTISSENNLVERFFKPNDTTAVDFFTAASFLAYGNNLKTVRAVITRFSKAIFLFRKSFSMSFLNLPLLGSPILNLFSNFMTI